MTAEVSTWSPTDLLIRGEFCPLQEIELAVERARVRADADAALLLVGDDSGVMRSLCACVPEGNQRVDRMRMLLASANLQPRQPKNGSEARPTGLHDYIRSPCDGVVDGRFPKTAGDTLAELVKVAKRKRATDLTAWLSAGIGDWVPARLPDRACGARMNVGLLFFEPRKERVGQGEDSVVVVDEDVVDISARVNSTAHADVRRDSMIMKRLDEELDPAAYVSGSVDFKAAATSLIELAVEVSGSDAGACYRVDHSQKSFELVAAKLMPGFEQIWSYPDELDSAGEALSVAATLKHLTLHLPPGLTGKSVRPTGSSLDGDREMIELATPLPGPLATPKAPAVGVLTMAKLGEARPYGSYEVAVVRNVALRLALLATTTNTTQAAEMFARLSMRAARLSLASENGNRKLSTPPIVLLPKDIEEAVPAIEDALSTLWKVTGAGTATFRAALPSPKAEAAHGLTLARVAGYPANIARNRKHAFQPESESGYNWCAVRSGEISNYPVIDRSDPSYSEHRKSTRSELSVPVYVEDRVVGVVNLESPVEHAFDAHVEIAQAAAEHIGLAIANSRLGLSALVQQVATDVLRRSHKMTHGPEALRKRIKGVPTAKARELTVAVNELQVELDGLRMIEPETDSVLPPSGDLSFPALVAHAVCQQEASDEITLDWEDGRWGQHERVVATALAKALDDVVDNALRHSADDADLPHFQLVHEVWGGQAQDVLIVRTETEEDCTQEEAINVYRCPLNPPQPGHGNERDLGDVHLGAYLAGLQIRRAGGDVHLTYEDVHQARVVVAVPAPDEEEDG